MNFWPPICCPMPGERLCAGIPSNRPMEDVADCGNPVSLSVDTGLCPTRDLSRTGVGAVLGYLVWDASGSESERARCGLCGGAGSGAAYRPQGRAARRTCLFDSPRRASHSMPHAYSFALEYARSACWGDCTSTMLSCKGITVRDPGSCHADDDHDRGPCEARGDVSAGSDGVSGAGASSAAGDPARPRGSGAGPPMGPLPARGSGIAADEPLAETLVLLVSELVTNAVVHTGCPAVLRLLLTGVRDESSSCAAAGTVRLEVADASARPPAPRHAMGDETGGRGLELVDGLRTAGAGIRRAWASASGVRWTAVRPEPRAGRRRTKWAGCLRSSPTAWCSRKGPGGTTVRTLVCAAVRAAEGRSGPTSGAPGRASARAVINGA